MTVKKETRRVEYWDCGKGHYHQTQEVAQRCADKQALGVKQRKFDEAQRREIAFRYLESDQFTTDIAREFGCHVSTVNTIAYSILRKALGVGLYYACSDLVGKPRHHRKKEKRIWAHYKEIMKEASTKSPAHWREVGLAYLNRWGSFEKIASQYNCSEMIIKKAAYDLLDLVNERWFYAMYHTPECGGLEYDEAMIIIWEKYKHRDKPPKLLYSEHEAQSDCRELSTGPSGRV